jgi:hypothetical protein
VHHRRHVVAQRDAGGRRRLPSRPTLPPKLRLLVRPAAREQPAVFAHSPSAARDGAVGCPTGENIAAASGTSPATLIGLWYGSPPHLANIKNTIYASAGLGFVIRTDPGGAQTIYGVTVFALC